MPTLQRRKVGIQEARSGAHNHWASKLGSETLGSKTCFLSHYKMPFSLYAWIQHTQRKSHCWEWILPQRPQFIQTTYMGALNARWHAKSSSIPTKHKQKGCCWVQGSLGDRFQTYYQPQDSVKAANRGPLPFLCGETRQDWYYLTGHGNDDASF